MNAFRDEFGLFGVAGHPRAVPLTIAGLRALAHRGDRGCGLATSDGVAIRSVRGVGDPGDALGDASLRGLAGGLAIGLVARVEQPEAPFVARIRGGWLGIAQAGRLSNGLRLAREIDERGAVRTTATDAELVAQLFAASTQRTAMNRLVDALWRVEGAFTILALTEDRLVAVRDPRGIRPLVLGRLDGATLFASDDNALVAVGADVIRDVEPGEMVIVDGGGARSVAPLPRKPRATCVQEATALAPANARVNGHGVLSIREKLGERLAVDAPCVVDIAVPANCTGVTAGFARASAIGWQPALLSGPDGRTLTGVGSVLLGARVAVLFATATPESVTRVVTAIRRAGAREVHVRIASPEARRGCAYGVTAPSGAAIAQGDADSTQFLTREAFREVLLAHGGGFCDACITGEWPVAPEADGQLALFTPT